jgi:predicted alpha/beta-hydrolase family hydrolase
VPQRFEFDVADHGRTSALVYRAKEPIGITLLLAPGAGAPQTHPFMVDVAERLAKRGLDVVTFDFLYAASGRRMPDRTAILEATWRAAIASVRARGGLPTERLFIGGKSMGGRIASHVAAADRGLTVAGLVFLGYPLHPIGKPKVSRDEHLPRVPFRMLFVQGSKDDLGTAAELRALAKKKLPRAEVHVVDGGDHSFRVKEEPMSAAIDAIVKFTKRKR